MDFHVERAVFNQFKTKITECNLNNDDDLIMEDFDCILDILEVPGKTKVGKSVLDDSKVYMDKKSNLEKEIMSNLKEIKTRIEKGPAKDASREFTTKQYSIPKLDKRRKKSTFKDKILPPRSRREIGKENSAYVCDECGENKSSASLLLLHRRMKHGIAWEEYRDMRVFKSVY